jgi:hypothetical protein
MFLKGRDGGRQRAQVVLLERRLLLQLLRGGQLNFKCARLDLPAVVAERVLPRRQTLRRLLIREELKVAQRSIEYLLCDGRAGAVVGGPRTTFLMHWVAHSLKLGLEVDLAGGTPTARTPPVILVVFICCLRGCRPGASPRGVGLEA